MKKINVTSETVRVTYDNRIIHAVNEFKEIHMTHFKKSQLKAIIESCLLNEESTKRDHVEQITQQRTKEKNDVKAGIFPKCGGELKKRKGKYGEFNGCSDYSKCRFTT
ncbi:topoisomerase DNA-binding C4 zinc finger domain-containing protein [Falsibacillus albus]|uniref:DNA topoisomerase type IA zn finger domain-containing protein n=1 Tax=Falsibacillus albus TaxID=2478915 RepID=A0A3L7K3J9_9BACI|nr:topoisomerase DNA-binding C4 zinc finger domain-containing protein [Falsibacillus albus]RLQ96849.1 hypothetical protein D9X91_07050 [Falsibacillus albus]